MFQSGMSPALGTSFMLSTMVIAVPSAIKTFNWLGTLWGGNIRFTTPMLNAIAFVSMFVIGGLSGIFMASTPVDIYIHDTYFIVAHIHYVVFGGSIFGAFAAIYYWFPKMFGRLMNETLGKIHFAFTFIGFNWTFFPMHILGVGGHMRRIYDPTQYDFLKAFQPMNTFITYGALILGAGQLILIVNFFWSMFAGKVAGKNPWQANTLEWEAPSPPRPGVRALGLTALLAVILQGVLGGVTVLYKLPLAVSVTHACLAQAFFCLTVTLALVTSAGWTAARPREVAPRLARLAAFTTSLV